MRSRVLYTGDGQARLFGIPFPYLSAGHVKVYLNKFPLNTPHDYKLVGSNSVELTFAPKQNDAIEVARVTPESDALVRFQNGSVLTEDELNTAVVQLLYLLQETRDAYDAALGAGYQRIAGNTAVLGATAEDIINAVVQDVLNSELLAFLQQRITDIDYNAEQLIDQRLRMEDIEALVAGLADIDGMPIATFIRNLSTERIEGDTALAETIGLLGAKSGDGMGWILDMDTVLVSPTESLATRLNVMQSTLSESIRALIATEQQTRATALEAVASQYNAMLARVGTTEAAIQTETEVRATQTSALTQRVDTMSATVGGHTAAIQQQATVTDGIKAQWTVKFDNNGVMAGFGLLSAPNGPAGVTRSEFMINADRLAFVTPSGAIKVPFAADANGVYMDTAFIRQLTVDRITGGSINDTWWLNNANGRIVLDTGTHMKVLGVGFGAHGDLIEWFGPKMAINACTKANGITWVGMNGDAYFGGALSAGTLYNAQRTTNTQHNAEVVCGPFATNGNPKTVVVSYSFVNHQVSRVMGPGGIQSNGAPSYAVIQLFRQIGTGTPTLVSERRFDGDVTIVNEFDGPDSGTIRIYGTFTFTDNAGLGDRTLTARIVTRSHAALSAFGGAAISEVNISQSLGIVSTEE